MKAIMKTKFKNKQHEKNYLRKMGKVNKIKLYHESLKKGAEANNNERLSNLRRMFDKGLISQEEYQRKWTSTRNRI